MTADTFIHKLLQRSTQQIAIYDREQPVEFIDNLFQFLFTPPKCGQENEERISHSLQNFKSACSSILFDVLNNKEKAEYYTDSFFKALPGIYDLLLQDAEAIASFDPAAVSLQEVLAAYPGFYATAIYRFAHQFYQDGIPLLPRFLTEHAHRQTGIDIHPGARIGHAFFIDHGTGIVIGQSAVIGNHVKLYQGVTLGALSTSKENANRKRHPQIGNHVIIYAGATILGGDTVVGDYSIIGGNVWLTNSVAPHSVVYHQSSVLIKGKQPLPEPLNFAI